MSSLAKSIVTAQRALLCGLMATCAVTATHATEATDADNPLPVSIRTCMTVKKNAERLACYDQAVEHLSSGKADAAAAPLSAESMFGVAASTPRASSTTPPAEREELAAVKARVAGLGKTGEGLHVIELDNGQTWRQTVGSATMLLKIGDEVTITRGALNSFRLSTPSGRVAKVNRVR
jgi:hypothetical protein